MAAGDGEEGKAAQPSETKKSGGISSGEDVKLTGDKIRSTADGMIIEPGTIAFGDVLIESEAIHYVTQTQVARTLGEAKVSVANTSRAFRALVEGGKITRSGDATVIDTQQFRMGTPPGYIKGDVLNASFVEDSASAPATEGAKAGAASTTSTATMDNATVYYQEPDFFSISIKASQILYSVTKPKTEAPSGAEDEDEEDKADEVVRTIQIKDAVVRVSKLPVFYFPTLTLHDLENPPIRPVIRMGEKRHFGFFLRTTTYYTGFKKELGLEPGMLFDVYTKAGVLVGPALDYKINSADPAYFLKGSLQGAWINDSSERGIDNYDNPIDKQRGFFRWEHKQRLPGPFEISASLNYWSDTSVLRDFRPADFHDNQRPDNFIEIVHPDPYFYASAFTRFRANDFQNVPQRLPEIRFDLNPVEIASTGIYQRFNAAFAYLYERSSPELTLPGGDVSIDSPRLDLYYGVTRPFKIADWFTFTPVAGVRSTTYLDPASKDIPYFRLLPQFGFDMHLLAQGVWDCESAIWDIHGLRHQLRPIVQYRWIPAADRGGRYIPAIDRYDLLPYPPPIDLSQKRYADDLWEQQVLRIGVENTLQTRDPEYGSRDLLWLNIYHDFRDTARPGFRTRSDIFTTLGIAPASWLNLEVYNRFDTYERHSNEISSVITVHDGDRWNAWFGVQLITDIANVRQFSWGFDYQLSTNYTLAARWRFDSNEGMLTEQHYSVFQRLGHTWVIEYYLSHRKDARQDRGFTFGASLRLNTY
ncbi:MAG: LPS-assembly protein LptD [Puniceicoccales bacterium]|nr:LPS-assembly protein LptD [Puniceicoccales bacterium]